MFQQPVYHMLFWCTARACYMLIQANPSLSQDEANVHKLELGQYMNSSLDLVMATSSGLILQICLAMAMALLLRAEGLAW